MYDANTFCKYIRSLSSLLTFYRLPYFLILHVAISKCRCKLFCLTDPCDSCKMSNGAGFTRHPSDCSKFIQCYFGINGLKKMSYQECPWGNFWDQASLTCQPAHKVKCPTGEQRLRIRRGFLKSKKFYYLMKKFRLHLRDNYIYLFQKIKVSNRPKRKHRKTHHKSRDINSSSESEDRSNASD